MQDVRYNQDMSPGPPPPLPVRDAVRPLEPSPELLASCGRGDRDAWARLFEQWKDRVYSIAISLARDPAEAADVTQDVFVKVLTRLPQDRKSVV